MRKNFFFNILKIWPILLKIDLKNNKKHVYLLIIKKLAFEKMKTIAYMISIFAEYCAKYVTFFCNIHYITLQNTMLDKFTICSSKLASYRKRFVLFLRYSKWKPKSKLNIFLQIFKNWFGHRIFVIFEKYVESAAFSSHCSLVYTPVSWYRLQTIFRDINTGFSNWRRWSVNGWKGTVVKVQL